MPRRVRVVPLALVLALSACGDTPAPSGGTSESQEPAAGAPTALAAQASSAGVGLDATYAHAVSAEQQLALGTLELADDLAVTPEQAQALLPLWTDLKAASMTRDPGPGGPGQAPSDAAPVTAGADVRARVDVLVQQIQAAMTPEQLKAIAEMKITRDSATAIMLAHGVALGGAPGGGGSARPPQGAPAGTPPGGGQPGGGAPGGGSPPPAGAQPPGDWQQPGDGGPRTGGGSMAVGLFEAVIRALGGTP